MVQHLVARVPSRLAAPQHAKCRPTGSYADKQAPRGARVSACCSKVGTGFEFLEHAKSLSESMSRECE